VQVLWSQKASNKHPRSWLDTVRNYNRSTAAAKWLHILAIGKKKNDVDINLIFALLTDLLDVASGTECAVHTHRFTDKTLSQKATQQVKPLVSVSQD